MLLYALSLKVRIHLMIIRAISQSMVENIRDHLGGSISSTSNSRLCSTIMRFVLPAGDVNGVERIWRPRWDAVVRWISYVRSSVIRALRRFLRMCYCIVSRYRSWCGVIVTLLIWMEQVY